MNYPNFRLCVRCFTYNQSAYITETLNGFTIQKTDFPFLCCIIDDASTDGEQNIIRNYLETSFDFSEESCHFNKETDYATITYAQHKSNRNCFFAVIFLKENLYSQKKDYSKLEYISEWRDLCDYEAICEGDDYWLDSQKLQIQLSFLDRHPEYGMSYSKAKTYHQETNRYLNSIGGPECSLVELLDKNVIPTLSVVCRRNMIDEYYMDIQPSKKDWLMGDYPMWLWFASKSKIHFINKETGVYRFLSESASHSKDLYKNFMFLQSFHSIAGYFAKMYNITRDEEKINNDMYLSFCRLAIDAGDISMAREFEQKVRPISLSSKAIKIIFNNSSLLRLFSLYRHARYHHKL